MPEVKRWLLAGALFLGLVGGLWLVGVTDKHFAIKVSAAGGELTEGILGSPPRFLNPLLAASDADRDLTALVYSGLMRVGEDGTIRPDLAASYEVSPDGLTYTFHLRPNLVWHDGEALTADDVEFTIQATQDPAVKSQRRAAWEGVKVEKLDQLTISFTLKQPYPSFLETTTMGILPAHIWSRLDRETFPLNRFNTESIGSGPYQIKSIKRDALGIPESYELVPFNHFALGTPRISLLRLRFYPNETELVAAYHRGEVEAISAIAADNAKEIETSGSRVLRLPLPRVFGVFFNQNRAPVLASKEVRQALGLVIDRQAIIDQVLHGYGVVATGPLPTGQPDLATSTTATSTSSTALGTGSRLAAARDLLTKAGWTWDDAGKNWIKKTKKTSATLALSLTTSDTPELKRAAELIRDAWVSLGVQVELKVFELGDLNQNIIRPRQYDALFFGEILGRQPDPFAFWDSSQRLDPGLNVALYANLKVDKILEEARTATDPERVAELYRQFEVEIANDQPAVFVYWPEFLYLLPSKVQNVNLPPINTAADRFLNIQRWYIATDEVWPVFVNQNNQLN